MYDYEIRDVMNRNKTPILDINVVHECEQIEKKNLIPLPDLSLMTNSNKTLKEKEYWEHFRLHFKVKNVGNLIAKFIKVKIKVPDIILKESEYQFNEKEIIDEVVYKIIFLDNTVRDVIDTDYSLPLHPKIKYGSRRFSPLLPELEFGEYILLKEKHILPTGKIFWKIYVDNSIPKEGEMNMEEIKSKSL